MICHHCSAENMPGDSWCSSCGAALSKAPGDVLIGRVIGGQFVLRRKIGEGGFGSVYLADQPSMGRSVVIKTLHPHLAQRPTLVQRFHREGITASKLEHPYAVKMYGSGETEDHHLWIAMEYLSGETFSQRIKSQGRLTQVQLLSFAAPLCEVLSEAHQKGIIHRDLKPDNIMLVNILGREVPKILDFGLAGVLHDDKITQPGSISGTPAYMPPEQWQGLSQTDHRSDIYSLGLIFYYALAARLPFSADSPMAWAIIHSETQPKSFSAYNISIPPSLERAILRAIAKRPEDRFQSIEEFYQALASNPSMIRAPKASLSSPKGETVSAPEVLEEPIFASAPMLQRPTNSKGVLFAGLALLVTMVLFYRLIFPSPRALSAPVIVPTPKALVVPAPSALAAPEAPSVEASTFEGSYVGSGACCGAPQVVRFTLSQQDGSLRGVWEGEATVNFNTVPLGSVVIEGQVAIDRSSILVRGVRWINNPQHLPLSSFRGIMMPDGSLQGEVDASGTGCFCTTFTFIKQ
jgi:serine/threonine protein kinase